MYAGGGFWAFLTMLVSVALVGVFMLIFAAAVDEIAVCKDTILRVNRKNDDLIAALSKLSQQIAKAPESENSQDKD